MLQIGSQLLIQHMGSSHRPDIPLPRLKLRQRWRSPWKARDGTRGGWWYPMEKPIMMVVRQD